MGGVTSAGETPHLYVVQTHMLDLPSLVEACRPPPGISFCHKAPHSSSLDSSIPFGAIEILLPTCGIKNTRKGASS